MLHQAAIKHAIPPMETIAIRLITLRKRLNLTQEQVAERSGISKGAISHYETGFRQPNYTAIKKLAAGLNCSLAELDPGFQSESVSLISRQRELVKANIHSLKDLDTLISENISLIPDKLLQEMLTRITEQLSHQQVAEQPVPYDGKQ